jgi:exopolysaccharide biosynthesis polyprenyl glycosylphosphotransferase
VGDIAAKVKEEALRPALGTGQAVLHAVEPVASDDAVGLEDAPARRLTWYVQLTLVLSDLFALMASYFVAEQLLGPHLNGGLTETGGLFVLTLPLWVLALKAARLYDRDDAVIGHSTIDELPRLILVATVGAWSFMLASAVIGATPSPGQLAVFWASACVALPLMRVLARNQLRRDPTYPQNVVIVGAGHVGQLLGRKFLAHPEYRMNLLGFVDDAPRERRDDLEHLTLLGAPSELPAVIERLNVERVIIAFTSATHHATMDLIRLLKDSPVRVDIVPRLFDVIPPRLVHHAVEGVPLISLPSLKLSRSAAAVKRTMDLTVSLFILLLMLPLLVGLAVLVRLDSRGPILFRQLRMGAGERPFRMFKFRTMVVDADERKADVAHLNAHARPGGDPRMFKIGDDPRVTRVGAFLRRYSLDELPQLLNVVRGEMSLIGPRPLILEEDRHIDDWGRKRLLLKPGMTGLWQVLGRSAIPFEEMVKLDYMYVTTWSFGNDVRLLLTTIPAILRGERTR